MLLLAAVERGRAEAHHVWPPELLPEEIDLEARLQLRASPGIVLEELFVVVAELVPIGEQRTRVVKPLAVPALGHHVDLGSDLPLVDLLWMVRIGEVIDARHPIHEA